MEVYVLPPTLVSWQSIDPLDLQDPDAWWQPWEYLRTFFESKGYSLFQPGGRGGDLSVPKVSSSGDIKPPAADSFGLHGNREVYKSTFTRSAAVFAARDSSNRDVAIKVVRKGDQGLREYNILRLLNSEPVRSRHDNATVTVLEFIEYEDWHFAVMPCYDGCDWPPFASAAEGLEFAVQVLGAISFLHDNHVAHLDVAYENIVMNHRGEIQRHYPDNNPFRSRFPVRYLLLDFGYSVHSTSIGPGSGFLIDPLDGGRIHRAPECTRTKFDPYAADVYQTARALYAWIHEIVPEVPGLLQLFQDMTFFDPSRRISARQAVERIRKLNADVLKDPVRSKVLHQPHVLECLTFPMVPLRYWSWLWDAICLGQYSLAWDLLIHYRRVP